MVTLFGRAAIIGKMRYFFLDRNYDRTVRSILIGLCIILTLLSTFLLRNILTPTDIVKGLLPVLVMVGLAGFVFVYSDMQLTAMLIFAVTMIASDGVGTGTGTKITFTFVLLHVWALVWLFKILLVDRKMNIRHSSANIPGLVFILVVVCSFLWSGAYVDHSVSFLFNEKLLPRLMTSLVLIISVGTYYLYSNHIRSLRVMRFIVWWFILIGAIFAGLQIFAHSIPAPLNAKGQFPTWVGTFAIGQMLFNTRLKWYIRVALGVIAFAWFYITLGLGITWLSGWVPLLVVFVVLMFFYSRKLFLLLLLGGVIYLLLNPSFVQKTFNSEEDESGRTRSAAWGEVLDLTKDHLLLGTGPSGYYFYFTVNIGGLFQLSHNNYVDILAQLGLTGLLVWFWFWLSMSLMTWRMYRILPKEGFLRGLGLSLLAGHIVTYIVMMLGDWVTPFTYTQGLSGIDYTIWAWIAAGMTVALYSIIKESGNGQVSSNLPIVVGESV